MRQDLWCAVRWLRKNPLFAGAVVFILALGVGANSAAFVIVDAVLLRPSPFPDPDHLVRVGSLVASDDEGGNQQVAVISDRLWRRRYQADPGVIGRGISISDEAYTIVGVMPPDFEFAHPDADLWAPLRLIATTPWLQVVARLRPGVSVARARSALAIVSHQMEQEEPTNRANLDIFVNQWRDTPDEKYKLTLIFVLVAVGLLMLIVCADVGGLLLRLESGLAFLLLVGSGLMTRSLVRLQQEDHGFRPDHVLTLRVPVGSFTQPRPTGKYDTRPRQMAYFRQILQRAQSVPGVKAAAIVNNPPLSDVSTSLAMGLTGPDGKPNRRPRGPSVPTILPPWAFR